MIVVDARSGERMFVGKTIHYPDDEMVTLSAVRPGIFHATLEIIHTYRDYNTGSMVVGVPQQMTVPIRYLHPAFMFTRVAFLPS